MLRRSMLLAILLATLTSIPGCIVHDPGYYPYDRAYYYDPYYPYYYGPYLYAPFWFGGYYLFGEFGRRHDHYGYRGYYGRGGGRRR